MASGSNTVNAEKKLSLKIFVDIKAKKVVFAEADNEFVDFIFTLMSLPLSTITKVLLLNKKSTVGCTEALYKTIKSLNAKYFEPNVSGDSVLKPRSSVTVPLLSLHEAPAGKIYKCNYGCDGISDVEGTFCHGQVMYEQPFTYVAPKTGPTYVKGAVVYMVMDNLEVKPMNISVIKSYVKDFDVLEEKHVEVGFHEGLAMLKASLETSNVLTTVFLKK